MFTLIKMMAAKMMMGASSVPLQAAAVVVLQLSSSTIQTNLTGRQVESGQHQIIEQQVLSESEALPADIISATHDGFLIADVYHDSAALDAPLVALESGVLDIGRSPASALALDNPYKEAAPREAPSASPSESLSGEAYLPALAQNSAAPVVYDTVPENRPSQDQSPLPPSNPVSSSVAAAPVPAPVSESSIPAPGVAIADPGVDNSSEVPSAGSESGSRDPVDEIGPPAEMVDVRSQVASNRNPEISEVVVEGLVNEAQHLYLASVTYSDAANEISHFAGLGNLTWTRVDSKCVGSSHMATEVWWALGDGGDSAQLEVHLRGATTNMQVVVTQWNHINEVDPVGFLGCRGSDLPSHNIGQTLTASEANSHIHVATGFTNQLAELSFADLTGILQVDGGRGHLGLNLSVDSSLAETPAERDYSGEASVAVWWSSIAVEIKPRP